MSGSSTDDDIWERMQATAHFLMLDNRSLQVLIGFALAWLINRQFKRQRSSGPRSSCCR